MVECPIATLPVVVYRKVLSGDDLEGAFKHRFRSNHWAGDWALGIHAITISIPTPTRSSKLPRVGDTRARRRGRSGIGCRARRRRHSSGGHRPSASSRQLGFLGGGAYPRGQEDYDEFTDQALCTNCAMRLRAVDLPERDPVFGKDGQLLKLWS